jgi:hypothetical protein
MIQWIKAGVVASIFFEQHIHFAKLEDYSSAILHGVFDNSQPALALRQKVRVKYAVTPQNREQKMIAEGVKEHPFIELVGQNEPLDNIDFILFVTVQAPFESSVNDRRNWIFDNKKGWNSSAVRIVAPQKVVVVDYADNPDSHKTIRSATDTREMCTRSGASCSDFGTG